CGAADEALALVPGDAREPARLALLERPDLERAAARFVRAHGREQAPRVEQVNVARSAPLELPARAVRPLPDERADARAAEGDEREGKDQRERAATLHRDRG